jgi:hypothetical protein
MHEYEERNQACQQLLRLAVLLNRKYQLLLFAAGTPDDEEAFYLRHGETRESLKVIASEQHQLWHVALSVQSSLCAACT